MAPPIIGKRTNRGLTGIVARERLFVLLDQWGQAPLIWVMGPPGAGKTMLVASYLESRPCSSVWYELDVADSDPAVFFQRLEQGLAPARCNLPRLTEEFRSDLAGFSRNFWPRFFARLPIKTTVVLDGLPLPLEHDFLEIVLREAVPALPIGLRIIVISREEPPPGLDVLQWKQELAVIGPEALRFDFAESQSLAAAVTDLTQKELEALHERAAGWAAGLRMLLEHHRRTGHLAAGTSVGGYVALFRFLASEVFDHLPAVARESLLMTSLLPSVTQESVEALARDGAWKALAELHERHLFVGAMNGTEPAFNYHALFKDFLQARARQVLGTTGFRSLQQRSAAFLAARGEVSHAIPLYAQAGEWVAAARLILLEAATLLAQGHSQTLRSWVHALPKWYVEASPRLLYCVGLTQSVLEPQAARATLSRAHQRFESERNALGQALTAAATIQTFYFQFDAFDELDPWIDTLHGLLHDGLVFPTPETELHVLSMLQIAMTYRQPRHPFLAACAERILELISRGLDVNQTVAAAGLLLTHCDWFAPQKARLIVAFVRPLLNSDELTLFNRLWWLLSEANHNHIEGRDERAGLLLSEIRRIACRGGTLANHSLMSILDVMEAGSGKNPAEIEGLISCFNPARRQEEQSFLTIAIPLVLQRRDRARALDYAERFLRLALETGHRTCELEAHAWLATTLNESGRPQLALASLLRARDVVRGVESPKIEFHHQLIEAAVYLNLGKLPQAHDLLRKALALARMHGYTNGFQRSPEVLARLCAEALSNDIEPQYVQRIIQVNGLLPPSIDIPEAWPWHVRIRVLGPAGIWVDGISLAFKTKAQKKPLELLRALVARGLHGSSQGVLAQQLWPDSEGDVAESALRMALHRLRKLLCDDECVIVQEGKLRLNEKLCWVDAWSLEALSDGFETMDAETISRQGHRLLALYAGAAFEGESEQQWMLTARDRWRSKFLRAVELIGKLHEARGARGPALEIYRRGLEAEPLSEDLYCHMMDCYLHQGKAAEAYSTYRRCRDMLSVTLGVRPAPPTEALRRRAVELGANE